MAAIEERDADGRKRGIRAPWIMLGPGGLWLVLFYALPLVLLLKMSLSSAPGGSDFSEFNADPVFNWHWSNFGDALSKYGEQFGRSFAYAGIATVAAMLIAFPIAYVIAPGRTIQECVPGADHHPVLDELPHSHVGMAHRCG